MINFEKLTFRNIFSCGNTDVSIDFVNGTTTLIEGKNGTGKSQIYEALFFALFNKPFRKINKDQMVNAINGKNSYASVEFHNGKNHIKVERGIKPNIFNLYVDGVKKENQASVKEQQLEFQTLYFNISEHTFRQIVVLGSTAFVPFMALPAAQRRSVIENLLDLNIFSTMLGLSRSELNKHKREVESLMGERTRLETDITNKKSQIDRLKNQEQKNNSDIEAHISKLESEKAELKEQGRKLLEQIAEYDLESINNLVDELTDEKSKHNTTAIEKKTELSLVRKELAFFEKHDDCPTCYQHIDSDVKGEHINVRQDKKENLTHSIKKEIECAEQAQSSLDGAKNELKELKELKDSLKTIKFDCSTVQNTIDNHKSNLETDETDVVKSALKEFDDELENLKSNLKECNAKGKESATSYRNYNVVTDLLKDSGVKAEIIATYLPIINSYIQKYLQMMDFHVSFTFDTEFKETIKSRGRDNMSYGNFSAGEKMRLDLAMLFTWRAIAKIKSSAHCNLIILDEIGDSSLDDEGLSGFNKILRDVRENQCVFIISHNGENLKGIDRHIKVEKIGNFSEYTINDNKE